MSVFTERVGLEHYCEITTSDGATFRWDANQPPDSRLRNLTFSTKIGDGFSLATGTLARRIDLDYPDLQLGAEIVITGADGTIVFEGRLSAMPREVGQTHSINVTFVGHMAHAKDRKFSETYVDRDLSAWGGMSRGRKSAHLTGNYTPTDGAQIADEADGKAGISTVIQGAWASPYKPISEMWYDAGPGNLIGRVAYSWQKGPAVDAGNANWFWNVYVCSDDKASAAEGTANLRAAGPSALQTFTPTSFYRYALLQLQFTFAPAGADGATWNVDWYKLAVYGNHGLTTHAGDPSEPDGLYLSDILRDIAMRFCPKFDISGVEDYEYVVQHCAYRERTYPHDAFLDLNKYALAHLAVWENKKLTFRPYDLSDYQWEIRTDDQGTTFAPVGPTLEDTYNGIVVRYTDLLTGVENVITPDDNTELRDTSDENPWNQAGVDHWYEDLQITGGQLEADALQIGRAVLAEKNRPKTAGTLTVQGYIRDRAGNPQPVSRVRAGDVICVTNFNEINRLIVETDYDDESKTLRVAVDFPFQLLEALFDRQANARQARGL
jgi:hypothetical protein